MKAVKEMLEQNIEIKGSKRVKSAQKILNSEGNQKLKVVDSEDVGSEQIVGKGEERGKTPNSREVIECVSSRKNDPSYWHELTSEICNIFKSVYQKYREKGESDVTSKTLTFLKTKLHDLAAAKRPFKWLDVGCGYGRALDVLDAVNVPRDMFEYHGIDAVHKYLDDAEEQAKKYNLVHYSIEKMDAAQMDFDSEFDLVSAVLLLHEVDPLCLPYVIRNMIRALKPEGTLVISDFQGPYEQEEGIVAWSADDIKLILESICDEAKASFEPLPAGKYPKELGFYACYVKKSSIDDKKFEAFMENYNEFFKRKKTESKAMRNGLRRHIKERVTKILERSDIDTKNISDEEMVKIKGAIEEEYGIKAHKIRLLTNQIEFLDDKIEECSSGTRCVGVD
jgi:ubiquinone/menaquinone biosynthesis C-methylase UbiE